MYVPWYGHMYQVLEVLISKFLKYQHVVRPVFHVVKLGPKGHEIDRRDAGEHTCTLEI